MFEGRFEDAIACLSTKSSIEKWATGKFKVAEEGKILYNGKEVPASLSARIHAMATDGESPEPLFKFWERLEKNPSYRSVNQLYDFLQNQNIPIIEDGTFYAYKAVRADYRDIHSGTILNKIGTTISMPRNQISDDPEVPCHEGLHVGALEYASSFGGPDSRLIICKIDPEHVVCVPRDHDAQKMRVCQYKVIGNHGTELPSTSMKSDDAEKVTKKRGKSKLDSMDGPELLSRSIEELRIYASSVLKIVGAYKIPGGKVSLVQAILKARG